MGLKSFRPVIFGFALTLSLQVGSAGASEPPSAEQIRKAVNTNVQPAVTLYREFLGFPNDAQHPADIERLIVWMEGAFSERGFETQRVNTAGSPALYAGRHVDYDKKTLLVYLQADGQPVDSSAWDQADPFLAVLKEQDINGRWSEIPWESCFNKNK